MEWGGFFVCEFWFATSLQLKSDQRGQKDSLLNRHEHDSWCFLTNACCSTFFLLIILAFADFIILIYHTNLHDMMQWTNNVGFSGGIKYSNVQFLSNILAFPAISKLLFWWTDKPAHFEVLYLLTNNCDSYKNPVFPFYWRFCDSMTHVLLKTKKKKFNPPSRQCHSFDSLKFGVIWPILCAFFLIAL